MKMKRNSIFIFAVILLFYGCQYDFPLSRQHIIPIDSLLLGMWEAIPEEGNESEPPEQMMVLKYSETEYMIDYPIGSDGIYFRGYPIKIGKTSCMQLEVIGDAKGPPNKNEKNLFLVATYTIDDDQMEIKILNTELIGNNLTSTEAIQQAFLENQDNENLFNDPGMFRKIKL
jgi:hypothetical protein